MNITRKTFYGIGILSAALNILGGAMLLFSIRADLGIVCAAASWPVFAWPYFKASVPENGLHKAAFLVMVCGLVLLVGSFLPVPQMLAACIIIAVAAVQGLLAFLLYQEA